MWSHVLPSRAMTQLLNGVNFVYRSLEVYFAVICEWGAVAQWLERATDNRVVAGSNPTKVVCKLGQFPLPPLCQCLSEETLKAVGPFYLVSMPGEVKDPT